MKFIKTFESFEINDLERLKNWAISYTKKYYSVNNEQMIEVLFKLEEFFSTDFPYGFLNVPKTITLYRILGIKKDEDEYVEDDDLNENIDIKINISDLGTHYVADMNIIDDDFIESIGYEYDELEYYNFKIVKIETSSENLDLKETLKNRILAPHELEYTIKNVKKVKIIDVIDY